MRSSLIIASLGALAAVALLGGCADDVEQRPWPYDSELGARLSDASARESRPVRELTGFDWSTLTVIDEGTAHDEALDLLGFEAFKDDYYMGAGIAVFCDAGSVVMETYLVTDALGGTFPRTVSRDAVIGEGGLADRPGSVEPVPDCVDERPPSDASSG